MKNDDFLKLKWAHRLSLKALRPNVSEKIHIASMQSKPKHFNGKLITEQIYIFLSSFIGNKKY